MLYIMAVSKAPDRSVVWEYNLQEDNVITAWRTKRAIPGHRPPSTPRTLYIHYISRRLLLHPFAEGGF